MWVGPSSPIGVQSLETSAVRVLLRVAKGAMGCASGGQTGSALPRTAPAPPVIVTTRSTILIL